MEGLSAVMPGSSIVTYRPCLLPQSTTAVPIPTAIDGSTRTKRSRQVIQLSHRIVSHSSPVGGSGQIYPHVLVGGRVEVVRSGSAPGTGAAPGEAPPEAPASITRCTSYSDKITRKTKIQQSRGTTCTAADHQTNAVAQWRGCEYHRCCIGTVTASRRRAAGGTFTPTGGHAGGHQRAQRAHRRSGQRAHRRE